VTVREGSANCFPYWLEGEDLEVGINGAGNPMRASKFLWMTSEIAKCEGDTGEVTGYEKCRYSTLSKCNVSKLERLALSGNDSCIPTLAWTVRPAE